MRQKRQCRSFDKINFMNNKKQCRIIRGAITSSTEAVIAVSPEGYAVKLTSVRVTRFIIINTNSSNIMKTMFKIVSQSEPVTINTQNGTTQKSTIVLQELGGKYENSYVASLLGNQIKVYAGDLVWASLRFTARDYNGSTYQDITIQKIISFTNH